MSAEHYEPSAEGLPEESLAERQEPGAPTDLTYAGAFEHHELSFKSKQETFNEAERAVQEALAKFHTWPDEQVNDIAFAVREAVINAVIHGNLKIKKDSDETLEEYEKRFETAMAGSAGEKAVGLEIYVSESEATISVSDEGDFKPPEFVETASSEPGAEEWALLAGSGRGLQYYIRNAFDDVRWEKGKIIMTVKRKAPQDVGFRELGEVKGGLKL